jgi:hypothetical protein
LRKRKVAFRTAQSGDRIPVGAGKKLLFYSASRPALGPIQLPINGYQGSLHEVKRPGRETDNSPPSSAQVSECTYTTLSLHRQEHLYLYPSIQQNVSQCLQSLHSVRTPPCTTAPVCWSRRDGFIAMVRVILSPICDASVCRAVIIVFRPNGESRTAVIQLEQARGLPHVTFVAVGSVPTEDKATIKLPTQHSANLRQSEFVIFHRIFWQVTEVATSLCNVLLLPLQSSATVRDVKS